MKHLKIKHKLFIFIVLGSFVTSLLGWLFVQQSQHLYEEIIYREAVNKLYLFSQRMEEKMKEIDKLSLTVMSDADVQSYLITMKSTPGTYEAFTAANKLKQKLLTYHVSDYSVSSIAIVDANTNLHGAGFDAEKMNYGNTAEIRSLAQGKEGASVWIGAKEEKDMFLSVRDIRQVSDLNLQSLGTLLIRVPAAKVLYGSPLDSNDYGTKLLIQNQGQLLYPGDSELQLNELAIDGEKGYSVAKVQGSNYLAASFKLGYTGWLFIYLVPYDSIFEHVTRMKGILLSLYAVVAILLLWIGLRFSKGITKPLEALTLKMSNVQKGHFPVEKPELPGSRDELGQLNRNFDKMSEKLNDLIQENYVKQIMLKEAEYEALKAKMNPHFLYNTLESINWLAKMNGQRYIADMVKALGDMMRSAVNKKEFVTMDEELANLRNYIFIQQFRFEERLKYEVNLPEHIKSLFIPCLIVQPIVENCIKYGVDAETGRCDITLLAEEHKDMLVIVVKDLGPGMDEAYLSKRKRQEVTPEGTGIGLHNIDERLRVLFGEPYGIEIESGSGQGTTIRICVPYVTTVL